MVTVQCVPHHGWSPSHEPAPLGFHCGTHRQTASTRCRCGPAPRARCAAAVARQRPGRMAVSQGVAAGRPRSRRSRARAAPRSRRPPGRRRPCARGTCQCPPAAIRIRGATAEPGGDTRRHPHGPRQAVRLERLHGTAQALGGRPRLYFGWRVQVKEALVRRQQVALVPRLQLAPQRRLPVRVAGWPPQRCVGRVAASVSWRGLSRLARENGAAART